MSSKRDATANVKDIRLESRQKYLQQREALKLAELRQQVLDEREEERRANESGKPLSKRELQEFARNRETLRLAESRLAIDDGFSGFQIPDANLSDKKDVLYAKKTNEKYLSEVDQWEQEVTSRAKAAQGHQSKVDRSEDYEFVFDTSNEVKFAANITQIDPQKQALQAQLLAAEQKVRSIEETRKGLPVYKYKDEIIDAVNNHKVVVLVSATGSGKTTQIPQFLIEDLERKDPQNTKMIACTQPRRVAAMSVAKRVAEEMGTRLGKKVGYSVRFDNKSSEDTRVLYLTDGLLLRTLMGDPTLEKYSCIMIDEAHERSVNTDILLAVLKQVVQATDLKLLISSATMNAQAFSDYFDKCPIFNIPGRNYEVDINYTLSPEANYLAAVVTTVFQVHISANSSGPLGSILVFLTGEDEITMAQEAIEDTARKLGSKAPELIVCPLYSALSSDLQAKVFEPVPPRTRKVILSTNIAETSVTIDGVSYVIDCGFEKQSVYQHQTGLSSLVITPISRASASQRSGRAGRTGPGTALRLYTKYAYYNELPESTPPEIQRCSLTGVVLTLKSLGVNNLIDFDLLDPPSSEAMISALEELYALQAITSEGTLSVIGRKLAEFPMDPKQGRAILEADRLGCVDEVLTIMAMLGESGSLFIRPKDKKLHAAAAQAHFTSKEGGDHLTLLNIYKAFEESGYDILWCKEMFLNYRSLTRARDVREQLVNLCERVEVQPSSIGTDDVAIRKAITAGYFANAARLNRDGTSYVTAKNGLTVYIHPSSVMGPAAETKVKWVLFSELWATSKEWMRSVMPIEPEWLTEFAPHYFKKGEVEKLGGAEKKMGKARQ
jgi:pre-mRNA-splicing factor ATP-dependent RNA helicase DHX16